MTGSTPQHTGDNRYRVMGIRNGKPYVVCQPLRASEAVRFAQGYASWGWYIEQIKDDYRPISVRHYP